MRGSERGQEYGKKEKNRECGRGAHITAGLGAAQLLLELEILEIQYHAIGNLGALDRNFQSALAMRKHGEPRSFLLLLARRYKGLLHAAEIIASILDFDENGLRAGMVFGAIRDHDETHASTPSLTSPLPRYLPHG